MISWKLPLSSYILRRPQNFEKSPQIIWLAVHRTNDLWRFRKILWPCQNIWTLINPISTKGEGRLCPPQYYVPPPGFSDIPTALRTKARTRELLLENESPELCSRHKSGLACSMFASFHKQLLICEEEEEKNYSSVKSNRYVTVLDYWEMISQIPTK